MTVTDQREVEELEKAVQAMRRAKNANLYDHRAIRMGLSKNIRLHEQAIKEAQSEKEDVQKEYQKRDEEGRRLFRASDGRKVVETEEGDYLYAKSGAPYISEEDQTEQVNVAGRQMTRAEMKQRTLRRLWEDVEDKERALEDINEREVDVQVHVLCGELASVVLDPSVQANEESFLYVFDDFREMMGKEIPQGFEPASENMIERLREREQRAEATEAE